MGELPANLAKAVAAGSAGSAGSAHLIQHLQQENQRLAQLVQAQQAALLQRGEPNAQAVLDVLEHWCNLAEQPGHPAQAIAQGLLKKWVAANDRARAAASGIVLASPPGSNGSS